MKVYQIILLLTLITFAYQFPICVSLDPSVKNCDDAISQADKNQGYHCCYLKKEGITGFCQLLVKDEYENIQETIIKMSGKVESLDCRSSYLRLGIFALLYLLI